ncbi:MAG: aminoacyl-histidine dipeptidase [Clostridia bacterium]|nr:aminoacyl-histidine dipeptidase [Clostridia bacterium]
MDYIIKGYEPECMFRFFEDISAIPRGSNNEAGIADFLVSFAQERNLKYFRDDLNNVLIKMPATAGYESEPAVLLQGHTDMVCEKNAATEHDFLTDPLRLYIKDGYLHADGTTLGADNGVAVALMMALLDGAAAEHPALECLFTSSEETGLIGAIGFDYSHVTARSMINLDVEGEGQVTVGCAGGCRTDIRIPVEFVKAAGDAMTLSISGLMGGHSGADITLGRANANKLMGRILLALRREYDYNLISFNGGLMGNAIPRECEAVITCANAQELKSKALKIADDIAAELCAADEGFKFSCQRIDTPQLMMNCASTRRVVTAIGTVQDGVLRMSTDIEGLAEFSCNLGVVTTDEHEVELVFNSRSAIESQLEAAIDYLDALADMCDSTAEHYSRYPGWKYAKQSPLRDKYMVAAREVLGVEPEVLAIHAGLECGVVKSHVPDMDIIAIGPNAQNIHTPDERLELSSFSRMFKIVERMLKK